MQNTPIRGYNFTIGNEIQSRNSEYWGTSWKGWGVTQMHYSWECEHIGGEDDVGKQNA